MIKDDMRKALAELDVIIEKVIPEEQTLKIPKKFREFIKNNKDLNHIFEYDFTKELEEQDTLKETRTLIGMVYLNYWATDEEKIEINHILDENERKYIEELNNKYSTDNLFKNRKKEYAEEPNEVNLPVEYKENIIKKIIKFIKNMFRRSN